LKFKLNSTIIIRLSQEEETAVEIHFPAGSEEMQSSLETGLQMLLSMEEGLDSSGLN
jgi:hypothetical protein